LRKLSVFAPYFVNLCLPDRQNQLFNLETLDLSITFPNGGGQLSYNDFCLPSLKRLRFHMVTESKPEFHETMCVQFRDAHMFVPKLERIDMIGGYVKSPTLCKSIGYLEMPRWRFEVFIGDLRSYPSSLECLNLVDAGNYSHFVQILASFGLCWHKLSRLVISNLGNGISTFEHMLDRKTTPSLRTVHFVRPRNQESLEKLKTKIQERGGADVKVFDNSEHQSACFEHGTCTCIIPSPFE
jgi:hypothetical protein